MVIQIVIPHTDKPIPDWYTPITPKLLRQITRHIVAKFQPERIILFGSYAYGKPTIDSDIDLLVITRKMANASAFERSRSISRLFPQRKFGMDVLVRTPIEIKQRLAMQDDFISDILCQGKILYERRNSRRVGSRSRGRLQIVP